MVQAAGGLDLRHRLQPAAGGRAGANLRVGGGLGTRSVPAYQLTVASARAAERVARALARASPAGGIVELSGKRAIVTGGGNGIGRATALRLAGEGAAVAVVDLVAEAATAAAATIEQAGGRALAIHADVTRRAEVEAL